MKSLETLLPGFTPSPLQQAAIKRIHEYKEELKQYGMYVRSAIELEFMVQDGRGHLIPGIIHLDNAENYLKNGERLPYIEKMTVEGIVALQMGMTNLATQYEVNIADQAMKHTLRPRDFAPENVAAIVQGLKARTIKQMLTETTCLNQGVRTQEELMAINPVFAAHPYAKEKKDSPLYNDETSSMHINVSLFDKDGRNIFALSHPLLDHCANALVNLQNEAGLAMLPTENSLARIGSNGSAPGGLGVEQGKFFLGNRHTSVCIRDKNVKFPTPDTEQRIRLENRLPGADADPFVAMAVTMAALVDAVRNNVSMTVDQPSKKAKIKVAPVPTSLMKGKYERFDLPKNHEQLVETFASARRVRNLLGDSLYSEILSAYGAHSLAV